MSFSVGNNNAVLITAHIDSCLSLLATTTQCSLLHTQTHVCLCWQQQQCSAHYCTHRLMSISVGNNNAVLITAHIDSCLSLLATTTQCSLLHTQTHVCLCWQQQQCSAYYCTHRLMSISVGNNNAVLITAHIDSCLSLLATTTMQCSLLHTQTYLSLLTTTTQCSLLHTQTHVCLCWQQQQCSAHYCTHRRICLC